MVAKNPVAGRALQAHLHRTLIMQRIKTQASYRAAIRSAVRGLWTGVLDEIEFFDAMESAIRRYFREAWMAGLAEAGIPADEMTPEESARIENHIFSELGHIFAFADAIEAGSKANGGALEPHMVRAEKWVQRYSGLKAEALALARTDPVLEWVRHAMDSCGSCLRLNGQRRRSSTWARLDIRPQSMRLECMRSAGGVPVCRCEFRVTDQPPTRGRMPKL